MSVSRQALLDYIGNIESGGNYNAIYGNAGSSQDLSQMSLNEVLRLQKEHGSNTGSSAIGKYQIIQNTLRGLMRENGIPASEKFTPELQEFLGAKLLEGRGYKEFAGGTLSPENFQNNLAKEWAAVPTTSGRSHYAGDKMGNKAGVTSFQFSDALQGALPGERVTAPGSEGFPTTHQAPGFEGPAGSVQDVVAARMQQMMQPQPLTTAQALERGLTRFANAFSNTNTPLPHAPPPAMTPYQQLTAEANLHTLELNRRERQRESQQQARQNAYRESQAKQADLAGDFEKASYLRAGMGREEEELLPASMQAPPELHKAGDQFYTWEGGRNGGLVPAPGFPEQVVDPNELTATQKARANIEHQIMGRWNQESGGVREALTRWDSVREFNPKTMEGAEDLTLAIAFNKMLSPNSSVMGGEVTTTQEAGDKLVALPLWMRTALKEGQMLTTKQRENILGRMDKLARSRYESLADIRSRYEEQFGVYGIEPRIYLGDASPYGERTLYPDEAVTPSPTPGTELGGGFTISSQSGGF